MVRQNGQTEHAFETWIESTRLLLFAVLVTTWSAINLGLTILPARLEVSDLSKVDFSKASLQTESLNIEL